MKFLRNLLCLVLLPPLMAERLPVRSFTTAEGLAHNHINCIRSDSRGFLWFCTDEGLSRFDGQSFTNYTTRDGLPHPWVNDLLETRDGSYWVATDGGVCRFNPSGSPRFRVYRPSERRGASRVNALIEDHDQSLWCGTYDGLYRMQTVQGKLCFTRHEIGAPEHAFEGSLINSVLLDRRGNLWAASRSGLYRRSATAAWERYHAPRDLPDSFVEEVFEDRDGQIWAITRTGGFCSIAAAPKPRNVSLRCYSATDGLPSNDVRSIYQSLDKRLWIGTVGGLTEFRPGAPAAERFQNYTTANGLSQNSIYALQEDRHGNLWMGTKEGGAMKLPVNGLSTYGESEGFRSGTFSSSIWESGTGDLYVTAGGSTGIYINRFDGRMFTAIPMRVPVGVDSSWETVTIQDRLGQWWVTTGLGLFQFPAVKHVEDLAHIRARAALAAGHKLLGNDIHPLYQDARGDLWFATSQWGVHELYHWDRVRDRVLPVSSDAAPSLRNKTATAITEDRSGRLWIGFKEGGLVCGRDGKFEERTDQDTTGSVQAVYIDSADRLWIGSLDRGLIRLDDPKESDPHARSYSTADGLSSNQIWCITEDRLARIYVGTGSGVDRLSTATGSIRHFTTWDGLAKGVVKSAYRDRHGALWFATNSGISRLIPTPDRVAPPPPIRIHALRVMGAPQPISELGDTHIASLELPANSNGVEIEFLAPDFGTEGRMRYQYKLEGADTKWSRPTLQRNVNLARLSPGSYRFLVRAVNSDGTSSPLPAAVEFTVLNPIWLRWWFLGSAMLAVGFAAYAGHRYRVNQLIELERVRTRIAADLHDDIGASLSQIAILSEVARSRMDGVNQRVAGPLTDIVAISSEVMDSMSDMVWAINPKNERLSDLVTRVRRVAGDMLDSRNIGLRFLAPEGGVDPLLDAEVRRQFLLIAKEAIRNIVRHSGATQAEIQIGLDANRLTLCVRDNGRGFDATKETNGNGLTNMRRRASLPGGSLELRAAPGEGTALTVTALL